MRNRKPNASVLYSVNSTNESGVGSSISSHASPRLQVLSHSGTLSEEQKHLEAQQSPRRKPNHRYTPLSRMAATIATV